MIAAHFLSLSSYSAAASAHQAAGAATDAATDADAALLTTVTADADAAT